MTGLDYRRKDGGSWANPSTGAPFKTICEPDPGAGGVVVMYSFQTYPRLSDSPWKTPTSTS